MKHITLIDYGAGNIRSVERALELSKADIHRVTRPEQISETDLIVLPGQGHFGQASAQLKSSGMESVLTDLVINKKTPYLGICLGLQLLFESSEESPGSSGFGWLKGNVVKFNTGLKVPHMGWNEVDPVPENILSPVLFENTGKESSKSTAFFYFVHSYHVVPSNKDVVLGTSDYGGLFICAVGMENIVAVQYHPEKSHIQGKAFIDRVISHFSH